MEYGQKTEAEIIATHIDPILENDEVDENVATETHEGTQETGQQQEESQSPIEGTDSTTAQEQTGEQQPTKQPEGDPNTAEGQPGEQQQQNVKSDDKGNLVDDNGKIVARAGAERRLYEKADKFERAAQQQYQVIQRLQQVNRDLEARAKHLAEEAGNTRLLDGMPQQLGLNVEETAMGMRLMANFKTDPVGTLKYILTEAKALGHNVDIEGAGQGIDMQAIARMIDNKIQPLTQNHVQQQQSDEFNQQIQAQVNSFFNNYPDAVVHEESLARLLGSDPNLSPDAAYYKLRAYATEKGLDWTQPLQPQILARQSQQAPNPVQQGEGQQQQNTGGQQQAPFGVKTSAPNPNVTNAPQIADADVSYDDIIRQSLAEAGL